MPTADLCVRLSFQLSPPPHRNFLCRCWLGPCELFHILRQYRCLVWKERACKWVDYWKYLSWWTARSKMSQMLSSKVSYLTAGNLLKWCGPFPIQGEHLCFKMLKKNHLRRFRFAFTSCCFTVRLKVCGAVKSSVAECEHRMGKTLVVLVILSIFSNV